MIGRFAFAALDATLPLRVQAVWSLDSAKVGLVYLASIVPTVVCELFSLFVSLLFSHDIVTGMLLQHHRSRESSAISTVRNG